MTRTKQLLGATSAIALVAFSASPALAAGTAAGDRIRNNVSVTYDVGNVTQTAETDFDELIIDRKVNLTVAEVDGNSTTVNPGQERAAVTFQLANLSNDTIDLALSVVQSTSDDFDITNIVYYVDNGDGVFDADTDTLVTGNYLDQVAPQVDGNDVITVHVVGDIPLGRSTGDEADVSLVATAHAGDAAGSLGTLLTATSGANTNDLVTGAVDTVLADGAGDVDAQYDGAFSDTDTFVVAAADVEVTKTSRVVSDPVNGTNNPKAIPGATIEYCIVVSNALGSVTATAVTVNDELPADVTFDDASGVIYVDGDENCENGTPGTAPGTSYNDADREIDAVLGDIAADTSRSVYFEVTID